MLAAGRHYAASLSTHPVLLLLLLLQLVPDRENCAKLAQLLGLPAPTMSSVEVLGVLQKAFTASLYAPVRAEVEAVAELTTLVWNALVSADVSRCFCVHACMCARMHACVHACMHACMCICSICVHMHAG
jgi:hypothetical protein